MANVLIRDLSTTILLPASNTYLMGDGATQGTVKFLLMNCTFVTTTRTTLAALSVTSIPTGVTVQTLGGAAVADGSASMYYYNSASSATPDGVNVIQPDVGSGRWLVISQSGLPLPTVSTLGGVFSKAAVTNQFLTSLGTDGIFTSSGISAAQISGLGNMAVQNSSAISVTGGSLSGIAIIATSFSCEGNITIGSGSAASTRSVIINGGTNSNTGSTLDFQRGGSTIHRLGIDGPITGSGSADLAIFAGLAQNIRFYANGAFLAVGKITPTGINEMAIGVNTPSTGAFTTLSSTGQGTFGPGGSGNANGVVYVNGSSATNYGAILNFARNGVVNAQIGNASGLIGGSSDALVLYSAASDVLLYAAGAERARVTSTGLNSTVIGATTPAAGTFTNITAASAANLRTIKGNFNLLINVKDYGALGDGATNDTVAIAAAVAAAISAKGCVDFPPGTYITDTIYVTSATGISFHGYGIGVSIVKARTPSRVLVVATSSNVSASGLTFDGNCTTRTAGQQAVTFDAANVIFTENEIINSGEYAVYFGSGSTVTSDVVCTNNIIRRCFADGINIQFVTRAVIANNVIDEVDDDLIAVGYNGSGIASKVLITGNYGRARTDLGTNWGRGILVLRSSDVTIVGNYIEGTKQYGMIVTSDGGPRPTNLIISQNTFKNCATISGHAVALFYTTDVLFADNQIIDPVQGNCLEIADWQNLTIQGGYFQQARNQFCRGIHVDEGGTWGSTWDTIKISRVSINMKGAATNSCVYLVPAGGVTMNTGIIDAVVGQQVTAGDYITVGSGTAGTLWKIVNNTTASAGKTVTPSSGGVFTVVNNN